MDKIVKGSKFIGNNSSAHQYKFFKLHFKRLIEVLKKFLMDTESNLDKYLESKENLEKTKELFEQTIISIYDNISEFINTNQILFEDYWHINTISSKKISKGIIYSSKHDQKLKLGVSDQIILQTDFIKNNKIWIKRLIVDLEDLEKKLFGKPINDEDITQTVDLLKNLYQIAKTGLVNLEEYKEQIKILTECNQLFDGINNMEYEEEISSFTGNYTLNQDLIANNKPQEIINLDEEGSNTINPPINQENKNLEKGSLSEILLQELQTMNKKIEAQNRRIEVQYRTIEAQNRRIEAQNFNINSLKNSIANNEILRECEERRTAKLETEIDNLKMEVSEIRSVILPLSKRKFMERFLGMFAKKFNKQHIIIRDKSGLINYTRSLNKLFLLHDNQIVSNITSKLKLTSSNQVCDMVFSLYQNCSKNLHEFENSKERSNTLYLDTKFMSAEETNLFYYMVEEFNNNIKEESTSKVNIKDVNGLEIDLPIDDFEKVYINATNKSSN